MNDTKKTKNKIKYLRTKKNILQTKIAMDLKLSQEAISSYETGRVTPSADVLISIADYFNTNIDYLLCRTPYDLPVADLKPNNITDSQFQLLTKINKLSSKDQELVNAYVTALIDKSNS